MVIPEFDAVPATGGIVIDDLAFFAERRIHERIPTHFVVLRRPDADDADPVADFKFV